MTHANESWQLKFHLSIMSVCIHCVLLSFTNQEETNITENKTEPRPSRVTWRKNECGCDGGKDDLQPTNRKRNENAKYTVAAVAKKPRLATVGRRIHVCAYLSLHRDRIIIIMSSDYIYIHDYEKNCSGYMRIAKYRTSTKVLRVFIS